MNEQTLEIINKKANYIIDELNEMEPSLSKIVNTYPKVSRLMSYGNKMYSDLDWDDETIWEAGEEFKAVMEKLNDYTMIVPSRELFCQFVNWNTQTYTDNMTRYPNSMSTIEDYILDANLSAGQIGIVAQNITKFRAQIGGAHGHGQVTQKEQSVIDQKMDKMLTQGEALKRIRELTGKGNENEK